MSDLPLTDFDALLTSWELSLHADGYPLSTRRSYRYALTSLTRWLAEHADSPAPDEVTRDHIRGWVVYVRDNKTANTARTWLSGVRHFFSWALAEQETDENPALGVKMPPPGEAKTPVLTETQLKAILATCTGRTFVDRRDAALLRLFFDGGPRLAELSGLTLDDVDLKERIIYVLGKGTRRSGPRPRAIPVGVKTAQAIDRYLRERRKHPFAGSERLWLGARGRAPITPDGVKAIVQRRAASCGIKLHPHMFRHTWASQFRSAGGSEGDLMVLGGWRSRAMLDRYGKAVAEERARDAYRKLSFGDRL
jgi:site-specific recombinase XerD